MLPQLWLLASLATRALSAPIQASDEPTVPELSPKDFDNMHGTYLVKFYSPYCPHCKDLAPKYDAAYKDLGAGEGPLGSAVKWAAVNCVDYGDFCYGDGGQGVQAYPTVRLYQDGQSLYQLESKPIKRENLRDFVLRYQTNGDESLAESAEKPAPIDQAKSLTTISKNMEGRWVVLFVDAECSTCDGYAWLWRSGELNPDLKWGIVDCSANAGMCSDITRYPFVRVFDDGELVHSYAGKFDAKSLRSFAKSAGNLDKPLVSSQLSQGASHAPAPGDVAAKPGTGNAPSKSNFKGFTGSNSGPVPLVSQAAVGSSSNEEKPEVDDVVRYTVETTGQGSSEDPGIILFGDHPEYMHSLRTWKSPSAPPPGFQEQPDKATFTNGQIMEVRNENFAGLIKDSSEPWLVLFTESADCEGKACQLMVDTYAAAAEVLAGSVNAAIINCMYDNDFCMEQNVMQYPHVTFYRGAVSLPRYNGEADVSELVNWTMAAKESQIEPVQNVDDLMRKLAASIGTPSFLYVSDESAMREDWDSAVQVAAKIHEWGGKVYRSDDSEVRSAVNIPHRGMVLTHVEVPGDDVLRSYIYPWSDVPLQMRDTGKVTRWAEHEKLSALVPMDALGMTRYAPLSLIVVGDSPEVKRNFSKLACDYHEKYLSRHVEDQKKLRMERLRASDTAMAAGDFKMAAAITRKNILAPMRPDLSFGFMNRSSLIANYSEYIPFGDSTEFDLYVIDFYNGMYVHLPESIRDTTHIDAAVAKLFVLSGHEYRVDEDQEVDSLDTVTISPFSKVIPGVIAPEVLAAPEFEIPDSPHQTIIHIVLSILQYFAFAICFLLAWRKFIRPRLQARRSRALKTH